MRLGLAGVAIVAIGLGGCGGGGDTSSSTTSPTTAAGVNSTSTAVAVTTTVAAGKTIVIAYQGGVVDSPDEVDVKLGDEVVIKATSDVAEEIHVHTFDKRLDLSPGVTGELRFVADIPGVHEVELEKAGKQLFRLRVQ